jgi:methylamine dehydrogenase light chain
MDDLVERLARKLAAHTSRRRLLGMLETALVGGVALPLLPVHRIVRAAEAADPANELGDQMSCDYWRYCGFDGNLCGCCGGTLTDCPPGSILSPTGWVGTCRHPVDGKDYIIAYRGLLRKRVLRPLRVSWRQGGTSLFTAPSSTTKCCGALE